MSISISNVNIDAANLEERNGDSKEDEILDLKNDIS
jgi:hypothetical protein